MDLDVNRLNPGKAISTIISANAKAILVIKNASLQNCNISDQRPAPIVFLIPTSRARENDRTVEREMKFIQAIIRMNIAAKQN